MNAFEVDMLLRRRLMEQKLLGPPQGLATIPSLFDLHMRQQQRVHAAQSYFPIGRGHGSAILPHPIDPATALLVESHHRANDLTMMMMMADEARKLHQLRFTAVSGLPHWANQTSANVLRNAIQAPQLILGKNNQGEEEESEEQDSEEEDEKVNEDHSVDSSNDSKSQKGKRGRNDKVKKARSTVSDDGKPDSKKDIKWLTTFEELKTYQKRFGDCIVPRGYSTNPRLASWVAEQRYVEALISLQSRIGTSIRTRLTFSWYIALL